MNKKKKLAIFITRMIRGGAQRIVLDLLLNLDRTKYDLSLIIGKTPESATNYLEQLPHDVKLIRCNYVIREIAPLKDFLALFKLKKLFTEKQFDILHLHTSKAGVLGSIAGRWAGIKRIIYTPHGHIFGKDAAIPGFTEIASWKKNLLFHLRRYAYKKCDKLVALSETDLKEQVDLKLAVADKFTIIMNGIDIKHYKEKVTPSCTINGRVIGSIGRLSKEKGHDILIEAFVRVLGKIPEARLLIVGDGPEKESLIKLVETLEVKDKVIFPGMVDDVRGYLQIMEVFVLPSRYESQGIVAMEAMASGVPVVASNIGGIPGIIEDGISGLLVPSGNVQCLSDTITKLLSDKKIREDLILYSLKKTDEDFRLEKMIKLYEAIYENNDFNS